MAPTFNDLVLLTVVMDIRTVLNVFLAWEVRKPSKVDAWPFDLVANKCRRWFGNGK